MGEICNVYEQQSTFTQAFAREGVGGNEALVTFQRLNSPPSRQGTHFSLAKEQTDVKIEKTIKPKTFLSAEFVSACRLSGSSLIHDLEKFKSYMRSVSCGNKLSASLNAKQEWKQGQYF